MNGNRAAKLKGAMGPGPRWMMRGPGLWGILLWLLIWTGLYGGETDTVHELAPFPVEAWQGGADTFTIPAEVKWIDLEQIDNGVADGMADLLRREANIHFRSVTGQAEAGVLDLRGFGENSGLRVLVLLDGFKINRPDMGGIDWQQVPLEDVQSVEVIKGGQAVLHGNHAVGGVIKISTRKRGGERVRIKGGLGSNGFAQAGIRVADGDEEGWYRLSANRKEEDGYRQNARSDSHSLQARFGHQVGERNELDFRLHSGESFIQFPGPLTYDQFLEDPRQSRNSGNESSRLETEEVAARWLGRPGWGRFDLNTGYKVQKRTGGLDGAYADTDVKGWSLIPKVRFGNGRRFLITGGEVRHDSLALDEFLTSQREIVEARADLERLTWGGFVYYQFPVGDDIAVSLGARSEDSETDYRYDRYDPDQINPFDPIIWDPFRPNPDFKDPPDLIYGPGGSFDETVSQSGWSGEVSANWQPMENLRILAGYDRVYRYPALDETASYQGYPLDPPVNLDLMPEEGDNFEAGIDFRLPDWELGLMVYHLRMKNEIVFSEALGANVNIGEVRRNGLSVNLMYQKDTYGFSAMWSFIDAELKAPEFYGHTVPLVPMNHGVVSAWLQPVDWLTLSADCLYTGRRYQGNDYANMLRQLDRYTLIGLQAVADLANGVKISLRIDNLFDEAHISTAFNGSYYPGSGRRLRLSVTIPFN